MKFKGIFILVIVLGVSCLNKKQLKISEVFVGSWFISHICSDAEFPPNMFWFSDHIILTETAGARFPRNAHERVINNKHESWKFYGDRDKSYVYFDSVSLYLEGEWEIIEFDSMEQTVFLSKPTGECLYLIKDK